MFSGTLRVKICEANGLRPTDYQKRFELNFSKNNDKKDLDPYVSLNVDEKFIGELHRFILHTRIVPRRPQNLRKLSMVEKFRVDKMGRASIFSKTFFLLAFRIGRQSANMYRMLSRRFSEAGGKFSRATLVSDSAPSLCMMIFPKD